MINLKPTNTNLILIAVLSIAVIIFGPLALIWSMNTLFPVLAIPYTIETWAACFLIQAILKSFVSYSKKD